jgi:hypothetical protein
MPRESTPLKRQHKGDVVINIADIFRNPEIQNAVVKECNKIKPSNKKNINLNKTADNSAICNCLPTHPDSDKECCMICGKPIHKEN